MVSWIELGLTWEERIIDRIDLVNHSISDVAIRPTLLLYGESQVVAYFDAARRLTVSKRDSFSAPWYTQTIESSVSWDSHNYIGLGIDRSGRLHVAGNMHASGIKYWLLDLHDFEKTPLPLEVLVDVEQERSVTYPRFLRDPEGELFFSYRNGTSGNGDFVCLRCNDRISQYETITRHPLIEGSGDRSAYLDTNGPILAPNGCWHMLWVWRDSPEAESTHTVNYASSMDLVNWKAAGGQAIKQPITNVSEVVVDPVPPGHGLINNNVRLGFLPYGQPVVLYHKCDQSGYQQIWAATFNGTRWCRKKLTKWTFRWDFSGRGSLDFQIEIGTIQSTLDGFVVDIRHGSTVDTFCVCQNLTVRSKKPAAPWSSLRRIPLGGGLYRHVVLGHRWGAVDDEKEWVVMHASLLEQRDQAPGNQAPAPQPRSVLGISSKTTNSLDTPQ